MLLGDLNDFKCPNASTYDALRIYNASTMMRTEYHPKCLLVLSDIKASVHENKIHHLSFKLYTHHYYNKNIVFYQTLLDCLKDYKQRNAFTYDSLGIYRRLHY